MAQFYSNFKCHHLFEGVHCLKTSLTLSRPGLHLYMFSRCLWWGKGIWTESRAFHHFRDTMLGCRMLWKTDPKLLFSVYLPWTFRTRFRKLSPCPFPTSHKQSIWWNSKEQRVWILIQHVSLCLKSLQQILGNVKMYNPSKTRRVVLLATESYKEHSLNSASQFQW